MYKIDFEEASGIVTVRVDALLSEEEFDRYAADLRPVIAHMRRDHGQVKILVDATAGGVLPADVARRVTELQRETLAGPLDRIAVVVASSLQKLQARRIGTMGKAGVFVSKGAALIWLSAYSHLSGAA